MVNLNALTLSRPVMTMNVLAHSVSAGAKGTCWSNMHEPVASFWSQARRLQPLKAYAACWHTDNASALTVHGPCRICLDFEVQSVCANIGGLTALVVCLCQPISQQSFATTV